MEIPEKLIHPSFPSTLGYVVWSLTMIPFAIIAIRNAHWKLELDTKSILYGCAVGFSGATGQLLLLLGAYQGTRVHYFPHHLFIAGRDHHPFRHIAEGKDLCAGFGRHHLVNTSNSVLVASRAHQQPGPRLCLAPGNVSNLLCLGFTGLFHEVFGKFNFSEGLFFYMAVTGLALSPIALWMTEFSAPINRRLSGPYLTAAIQSLNSLGCLLFVYAGATAKPLSSFPWSTVSSRS
jgi:hypothetical protein